MGVTKALFQIKEDLIYNKVKKEDRREYLRLLHKFGITLKKK